MWVRFPLPALSNNRNPVNLLPSMKTVFGYRFASLLACLSALTYSGVSHAQSSSGCSEISNDVSVAVSKDSSKVLMVVEDALVINEGCAADIVRAAIIASKADPALAAQIVQTAVSVAPKMASVIHEAAGKLVPGLAIADSSLDQGINPVILSEKNPGKNPVKNPVLESPEPVLESPEPSDMNWPIRGAPTMLPVFGPLLPRQDTNPVSPSNAVPRG